MVAKVCGWMVVGCCHDVLRERWCVACACTRYFLAACSPSAAGNTGAAVRRHGYVRIRCSGNTGLAVRTAVDWAAAHNRRGDQSYMLLCRWWLCEGREDRPTFLQTGETCLHQTIACDYLYVRREFGTADVSPPQQTSLGDGIGWCCHRAASPHTLCLRDAQQSFAVVVISLHSFPVSQF